LLADAHQKAHAGCVKQWVRQPAADWGSFVQHAYASAKRKRHIDNHAAYHETCNMPGRAFSTCVLDRDNGPGNRPFPGYGGTHRCITAAAATAAATATASATAPATAAATATRPLVRALFGYCADCTNRHHYLASFAQVGQWPLFLTAGACPNVEGEGAKCFLFSGS